MWWILQFCIFWKFHVENIKLQNILKYSQNYVFWKRTFEIFNFSKNNIISVEITKELGIRRASFHSPPGHFIFFSNKNIVYFPQNIKPPPLLTFVGDLSNNKKNKNISNSLAFASSFNSFFLITLCLQYLRIHKAEHHE